MSIPLITLTTAHLTSTCSHILRIVFADSQTVRPLKPLFPGWKTPPTWTCICQARTSTAETGLTIQSTLLRPERCGCAGGLYQRVKGRSGQNLDDGSHTMGQQMTSLQYLWKAIEPGGMHVCEDIRPDSPQIRGQRSWNTGQDERMKQHDHRAYDESKLPFSLPVYLELR